MMPAIRRVVLAALLVLAVAGCGGEDATGPGSEGQPEPSDESAADDAGEDTTPGDGDASASGESDEEADVEATIAVEGEQVRGGVQRIEAALHDLVTITVTSDVADEVHIHGYDLTEPVAPGEPMTRTFQADIPGVFEIELEDRGLKLADLEVGG